MPDTRTRETQHISMVGWIVLVMAMISLTTVLWTSYQDRVITECQKDLNSKFLEVLKDRADIADDDRTAIRTLVEDLVEAKTDEETATALANYEDANNLLDDARAEVQYPQDTELCN